MFLVGGDVGHVKTLDFGIACRIASGMRPGKAGREGGRFQALADYGQKLKENLKSLHERLKSGRWRHLNGALYREQVVVILECDIRAYFDRLDGNKLREMLKERIADGSLMLLIGKCLRVGVLDGEAYQEPEEGTAQGSILSPLLGNNWGGKSKGT